MSMNDDKEGNIAKAIRMVCQASSKGAQVVCLSELFTSPYFPREEGRDASAYEDTVPGPLSLRLSDISKELGVVLVAGSVFERSGRKTYNTSMVFDADGRMLGSYRKVHIPHDPGFYEQGYVAPGDLGFKVFQTRFGRIAPLICYDQWFPEAARIVSLMGAELIVYPTAIGVPDGNEQGEGDWHEAWRSVMRGHAIANAVAVAGVNRTGREGDTVFWGGSFVCSQFGAMLDEDPAEEGIIIADIETSLGKDVKDGWGFFRNRRPETYSRITERI
jgi:agmatine deiminase